MQRYSCVTQHDTLLHLQAVGTSDAAQLLETYVNTWRASTAAVRLTFVASMMQVSKPKLQKSPSTQQRAARSVKRWCSDDGYAWR